MKISIQRNSDNSWRYSLYRQPHWSLEPETVHSATGFASTDGALQDSLEWERRTADAPATLPVASSVKGEGTQ